GEPATVARATRIVNVELIFAQVETNFAQVFSPDLGGGDAGLKIVIDLASQRVAVQTPLLSRSRPAVEIEGRRSRAHRALDTENVLHTDAQTWRRDLAIIAPETHAGLN